MRKLSSNLLLIILLILSNATNIYPKDPTLTIEEAYFSDQELIVNVKLENGLDFDRLYIIRKGITVKLMFTVEIIQKNVLWPDKVLKIKNQKNPLTKLTLTKELTYDYITKNYIVKTMRNYSGDDNIEKYYSGDTERERFNVLKQNYFDSTVQLYLDLDRISFDAKQDYHVRIKSSFQAVKTFPTFIPNPFNFETASITQKIEKQ